VSLALSGDVVEDGGWQIFKLIDILVRNDDSLHVCGLDDVLGVFVLCDVNFKNVNVALLRTFA
jgi:hypothetical protein